jgi:hypothetical protein
MAEKKVIELEVKTESVGNLKAELRKAQAEVTALAEKFGATSNEAINAAKRAAELKDAIADAKALTDAYNPDAKFNALSASIGGVLNGFQAFEGALGLVGVEGEALQETLLKVQSAMALTQGINGVLEAKEDFQRLGKQISDVYSDAIKGFKGMTAAGKAFAVTGIGLLITGLGLVISYWDDIKKAIGGVTTAQEDLNSTLDAYKEGATEAIKQTTEVGNAFDLAKQGVISKDEALHLYNETLGDSFGKAKNLNEAEKLYADKTDAYIKATALRAQSQALFAKAAEEQVKALTANLEDQTSFTGKASAGLKGYFFGIKEGTQEYIKAQKEGEKQTKKTAEARANQLNDLAASLLKEAEVIENKNKIVSKNEKATNDEIAAKKKEAADKSKAIRDKALEEEKRLAEERRKFLLEQEELDEIRAEQAWQRKQEEHAKMLEEELALEEAARQRREESEAAEEKRQIEAFEREKELRLRNKEFAFQAAQDTFSFINNLASQTQQKYEALNKAVLDNDKLTDKEKQKLIDENNKRAKKAFEVQKAVSIASALVATYQSAVSAYQSQFLPLPDPSSPIRGAIAAGLAVAAGLTNVKNIASQKFEGAVLSPSSGGGGGGSTSGGTTSSSVSPNFNIVGNAQATNPLAGLGNQPLQAYVVSGEVTTAQSLDRNRINYATFG